MRLTDKPWEKIQDIVPDGPARSEGRGRPWRDKREVLEGILWVVKTGTRWRDLPEDYPPYQDLLSQISAVGGIRGVCQSN